LSAALQKSPDSVAAERSRIKTGFRSELRQGDSRLQCESSIFGGLARAVDLRNFRVVQAEKLAPVAESVGIAHSCRQRQDWIFGRPFELQANLLPRLQSCRQHGCQAAFAQVDHSPDVEGILALPHQLDSQTLIILMTSRASPVFLPVGMGLGC